MRNKVYYAQCAIKLKAVEQELPFIVVVGKKKFAGLLISVKEKRLGNRRIPISFYMREDTFLILKQLVG